MAISDSKEQQPLVINEELDGELSHHNKVGGGTLTERLALSSEYLTRQ